MQVLMQVRLPVELAVELKAALEMLVEAHAADVRDCISALRADQLNERSKALTPQNVLRVAVAVGLAEMESMPKSQVFAVLASNSVVRGRPRAK
jgi:hypothetical protein